MVKQITLTVKQQQQKAKPQTKNPNPQTAPKPVDPGPFTRVGHWDASRVGAFTVKKGTDKIINWRDESNSGFDLGSPGNFQPILAPNSYEKVPAVKFVGKQDFLQSTKLHATFGKLPFTWIVVMRCDNTGAWSNIFSTNDKITAHGANVKSRRQLYSHYSVAMTPQGVHGWSSVADVNMAKGKIVKGQTYVYVHRWDGTKNYDMRLTNVFTGAFTKDLWNPSASNFQTYVKQGGVVMGRGTQNTGHPFTGLIAEAMAYPVALPDTQLTKLEAYLTKKWAKAQMIAGDCWPLLVGWRDV